MPGADETFADVLTAAVERRRVSLTWLRDRLEDRGYRISLATLSYWRSGQREPARTGSIEALGEIEALLGLDEGRLTGLVRRRRVGAPVPFDQLVLGAAGEVVGEEDVDRVLFHLVADVDRAGGRVEARVTQIFVATRDGAEGVSMFVGPDVGGDDNTSRIEAISGCRIGTITDRDDGIRAAWLEFERPLVAGESVVTEVMVVESDDHGSLETEYGVVAEQRLEECLVLVRFPPDDVPRRCWVGFEEDSLAHEWEVDLAGATSVHQRQTAFGPGVCRVRWEW